MVQSASLRRSSSVDELLPKQLLPLPDVAAYGTSDMLSAAAAAAEAAAATAEAAEAAAKGLSEEDEQQLMQKAAEAYLMSVHLEAKSLPVRVAAACDPHTSKEIGRSIATSAATQEPNEAPGDSSRSTSSTHYVQRLLRLQQQQQEQQQHPPHPEWEAEALDFFRRIRAWLQEQRDLQEQGEAQHRKQQEQKQPLALYLRCKEWTQEEWRLYCRRFPPTLPLLLQCDVRCSWLLLQVLLQDLDLQLQYHARRERAATRAAAVAARPVAADAARTTVATTAEEELLSDAVAEEPPRAAACCQAAGSPTSLPQLFWLFAVLAAFDEIEARICYAFWVLSSAV